MYKSKKGFNGRQENQGRHEKWKSTKYIKWTITARAWVGIRELKNNLICRWMDESLERLGEWIKGRLNQLPNQEMNERFNESIIDSVNDWEKKGRTGGIKNKWIY